MDSEIKDYLDGMKKVLDNNATAISNLKSSLDKHIAFSEGLGLPRRMKIVESEVYGLKNNKASWKGLYVSVTLMIAVVSMVLAVAKYGG